MNKKKTSILYVDDEDINLRVFKLSFRREFDIHLTNSAKEALEIIEREKIDIIITDQRMPEMTGVELLEEIQKRYPNIPPARLILSGYTEVESINTAYEKYNLYKFISKPWNEKEIKRIFYKALEVENYEQGKV